MLKTLNLTLRRLLVRSAKRTVRSGQKQAGALLKLLLAPKPAAKNKPSKPSKAPARLPAKTNGAGAPRQSSRQLAARRTTKASAQSAPGKWLSGSHATDGAPLAYRLYLPRRPGLALPAGATRMRRPLLVMLHGCEQSAGDFARGTRMNQLAEKKGWAVLYPQQCAQAHPNRCWKWYERATQTGGGDAARIAALIEQTAARYPIDRARIYLCGLSAGAAMAHIVALHHPHLIAALGLHSAPLFGAGGSPLGAYRVMQHGDLHRMHHAIDEVLDGAPDFPGLPAILIQGEDDAVVRPVNQRQLEQQCLRLNRCALVRSAPAVEHSATRSGRMHAYSVRDFLHEDKPLLRVVQIRGLAHAWSGGDDAVRFNSEAGPDASKMMITFFARHRRVPGAPSALPGEPPRAAAGGG